MTFARLTRGDWLAAVAALALLLVMAMDWYSTQTGEDARRDEKLIEPRGATAGEVSRALDESARIAAEEAEQNAWQADAFPDRLIVFALLAAAVLAIAAAWLRAAGVRFQPPWTPSALASCVGLGAAVLLVARIIQKPSVDVGAVVKLGAPLGVVCVGTIALGARAAWNAEKDGSAWESEDSISERSVDPFADTDETEAVSAKPAPLFDHAAEPEPAVAPTATAVRPVVDSAPAAPEAKEDDEDWAPDWDDPATPAAPESGRRRGRTRRRRRRS